MHIPDGLLDGRTALVTGVFSLSALTVAVRHCSRHLPPAKIPLLGLSAAFIFAAQMVNFPIGAGTSGHLIGGVLAAALLGPSAAVIVLFCVLLAQALLFGDGGILSLGANLFNMGLIGGVVGWMIYSPIERLVGGIFGRLLAALLAGWVSTVLASICCAAELATSGTVPWAKVLPAMAGIHAFIGLGEGLITALVLGALNRSRPNWLTREASPNLSFTVCVYGLLVALGVAVIGSPLASEAPDGLDKTAATLGFEDKARTLLHAPIAEYKFGSWIMPSLSTPLAGAMGTLVVFAVAWILARLLLKQQQSPGAEILREAEFPRNQ